MNYTYIDKYLIYHYARKSAERLDASQTNIICYKDGDIVGYINFYLEGEVPESVIYTSSTGTQIFRINFEVKRVNEILNTLRYEKPIHIGIKQVYKSGWVGTSSEPVGEEEGV